MNRTEATVSCPKCMGTGHLDHFRHIRNGDCYRCGASGNVGAYSVSKEVRNDHPATASKRIELAMGVVEITRWGTEGMGFQADLLEDEDGRLVSVGCAWFDIVGGRVVGVELSLGMTGRGTTREIGRQLQGAFKG